MVFEQANQVLFINFDSSEKIQYEMKVEDTLRLSCEYLKNHWKQSNFFKKFEI